MSTTSASSEARSGVTTPTVSTGSFNFNGLHTTLVKLDGTNYPSWSIALETFIYANRQSRWLEQDPPEESAGLDEWKITDATLRTILWSSMTDHVRHLFMDCKTAREVWTKCALLYSGQNNMSRVCDVWESLFEAKISDAGLTEYYARFASLCQRLRSSLPPATTITQMQQREANMLVVLFLRGLGSDHNALRQQVTSLDTLPSIEEVYSRAARYTSPSSSTMLDSSAMVARGGQGTRGRGNWTFNSRGRGRGVPGRGVPRGGSTRGGRGGRFCTHCQLSGHTVNYCYDLHPELRGLQASIDTEPRSSSSGASLEQNTVQLTRAEYDDLQNRARQPGDSSAPVATLAQHSDGTCLLSTTDTSCPWVIDSGATHHMTGDSHLFTSTTASIPSISVKLADGSKSQVTGTGCVSLNSSMSLPLVYHIPRFPHNLLSVSSLTRDLDCNVTFSPSSCVLQDRKTGRRIGGGREVDGLYLLDSEVIAATATVQTKTVDDSYRMHCRLGHPSKETLGHFPFVSSSSLKFNCETCQLGKHHRVSFPPRVLSRASQPFELVHSDVWGPSRESSFGFRYFVTFIDDCTRTTWLYLIKDRTEVFHSFCQFYHEVGNQYGYSVKCLRTDNAREYFSSSTFIPFLESHGILHQSSCAHTPQQNGVAERKNRHLLDVARCILLHTHVPKAYWSYALLTACHLINRLPSSVLKGATPYSLLHPNQSLWSVRPRIFGCVCFVHNLSPGLDKLSPRAEKCVFVGYSRTQKGYVCYSPSRRREYVSADVTFFEDQTFFGTVFSSSQSVSLPLSMLPSKSSASTDTASGSKSPPRQVYVRRPREVQEHISPSADASPPSSAPVSDPLLSPSVDSPIAHRTRSRYPLAHFVSYHSLSPQMFAFVSSLGSMSVPCSVQEALAHPGWTRAMAEEMTALHQNKTWELVSLPPDKQVVGCRWVFVVKYHPDGSVERLKARLVAKGYTQNYGIDYDETFSPVAKIPSVRVIISLAARFKWTLHQLDVKNAFLHGDLHEEVYMEQPPGFVAQREKVCRLRKALYGLKQSPRAWFGRFSDAVTGFGMHRCSVDHSVFSMSSSKGCVILVVYVDDILVTGSDVGGIKQLKQFLQKEFNTKDLGVLRYFLGIEVAYAGDSIALSQRKYTLDILKEVGLRDARPDDTPMDPRVKLDNEQGQPLHDPEKYRRLVGKLNYLTITRPDISFAVSVVSQFMSSPRTTHWEAVLHIIRYLKGAPGQGLVFHNKGHLHIAGYSDPDSLKVTGYSDADWAGCPVDRRSISGYCVFLGGNLVSWKSKKQSVVSRSSAEAEYRAMANVTSELQWIRMLLVEIGLPMKESSTLHCDNQSAMHIASNPVFHERTKHIEVDCHFIREKVNCGDVQLIYTRSEEQLADIFTKPLRRGRVSYICSKLGLFDMYAPT